MPVAGLVRSRWPDCSRRWRRRSRVATPRGAGWPAVVWSRSMGPVWICPTLPPTTSTSQEVRLLRVAPTLTDHVATLLVETGGRPGVMKGERSAFPQARVVALAECGTHAMFEAVIGAYTTSEPALSLDLLGRLCSGMLCLADRGFYSFKAWEKACGTGADLLWRVKSSLRLDPVQDLPDGSFLADVYDSVADKRREHPVRVRVISYTIEDGRDPAGPYRLITTLLDHREAPAAELAGAYAQRWEIETSLDELKTHQRGARAVLRSKSPGLVIQEIWDTCVATTRSAR